MKAAKNSKEVAKILQKSCKKIAKKLQKSCKMLQSKLQKVLRVVRSDNDLQKVVKYGIQSQKLVL